jgi:hypothetical protein
MERHAPEPKEPIAPVEPPKPPTPIDTPTIPQTKGQKRFAELAHAQKQAEERAAAAEKKAAELEARLTTGPTPSSAVAPAPTAAPSTPSVAPVQPRPEPVATRPKPTEAEIGTKYAGWAEFTEDLLDWRDEQRHASTDLDGRIRETIERDRAAQALDTRIKATHDKGRTAYADFDQVYQSGPGGQVKMPLDRLQAIYDAPHSEHIQYAVMKDAALAQKLASLAPIDFGMELSKLVSAHTPAAATTTSAVSPAPAPFTPVASGSKTTVPTSADLAKKGGFDFDSSGYRERRAAERGLRSAKR